MCDPTPSEIVIRSNIDVDIYTDRNDKVKRQRDTNCPRNPFIFLHCLILDILGFVRRETKETLKKYSVFPTKVPGSP